MIRFPTSSTLTENPGCTTVVESNSSTTAGPAIVEEFDSTTVVHPGYVAVVDEAGNLLIERGPA